MRTRRAPSAYPLIYILLAIVGLLECFGATTWAQSATQWRQLAPIEGGTVNALLSEGGRVYAGTSGRGVFVSTDNAQTWRAASNGLGDLSVTALGAAGSNVLAVTNVGIYRSADGGESWTRAVMDGFIIRSLMVTSAGLFAGTVSGRVYRSPNNGQSWTQVGSIPNAPTVYELAALGTTLFAATSSGVFRSTDQGQSWTASSAGLPNNAAPFVIALVASGNTLYAGTRVYTDSNGVLLPYVYSSTDNGQSWSGVGRSISLPLHGNTVGTSSLIGLAVDGTDLLGFISFGMTVFNGQSWVERAGSRGLPVGLAINTFIRSGETALVGTSGGVYVQASDGQGWMASNSGLTATSVAALAVSGDAILASDTAGALFRSVDDGQSWTRVSGIDNGNGRPLLTTKLVVRGGAVYAAGNAGSGVFRSLDEGASWTPLNNGFSATGPSIRDLTASNDDLYAVSFNVLYRLNAESERWAAVNANPLNINLLAASGANVYAIAGNNLLRSTDKGANFTPVNFGSPLSLPRAIAARASNVYFAATTDNTSRLFVSTDNGESFNPSQTNPRFINAFAFKGDTIYAGSFADGVLYSVDNGRNWTPVGAGLINRSVNALAVKGDTVLAGVNFYGVFAATNPEQQPARLASVSAASFGPANELAPASIAVVFGTDLTTTTSRVTSQPLPTTLAGTRVVVRDSQGVERDAPLYFISPNQINYQVPPDTAPGTATVIVISNSNASFGNVTIAPVAPGLFAANANGMGLAAAVALRIKADGTQTFEPIANFNPATGQFSARPLDLGPDSDQVFLVLYGTGIRLRSALSAVTARIGGLDAEVVFAGAAPGLIGADQINVRLSRQLSERGDVAIALTIDGKTANTVGVTIR